MSANKGEAPNRKQFHHNGGDSNFITMFHFSNYSSFLLLFFVHFIVFSGLLFLKYVQSRQNASLWLAIFLALSALYIAPWMLGFAGWYSKQPYRDLLLYFPTQHLFFMGPVVLFYIKSLLDPGFQIKKKDCWHFVPGTLWCLLSFGIFLIDKIITHQYTLLKQELDPDFLPAYQIPGFLSVLLYFVIAFIYHRRYQQFLNQVISNADGFRLSWVRHFLLSFVIILVGWLILAGFGLFYEIRYTNSWWYFMGFSIIVYYISIAGLINSYRPAPKFRFWPGDNRFLVQFLPDRTRLLDGEPFQPVLLSLPADKNAERDHPHYEEWSQQLRILFTEKECYLDPALSLPQLAAALGTNTPALSRFINSEFKKNFNDLINQYRVEAFISKLKEGEHSQNTLLALAFDCGFNSKNTFNRAFKKEKGCTPSQYLRDLKMK